MHINVQKILKIALPEPALLRIWLHYQQPLTDKLLQSTGSAELAVLEQGWRAPGWWDKYLLQVNDSKLFQREIIMQSHGQVYWYARTLIPKSCYSVQPEFFERLQRESLRHLIYDNPDVTRVGMVHYPVNHHCLEYYWVKKHMPYCAETLWVRMSEFTFMQDQSFYLMEILMPELEQIQ